MRAYKLDKRLVLNFALERIFEDEKAKVERPRQNDLFAVAASSTGEAQRSRNYQVK